MKTANYQIFYLTTGETVTCPMVLDGESWDWQGSATLRDVDMRDATEEETDDAYGETIVCTSTRGDEIAKQIQILYGAHSTFKTDEAKQKIWDAFCGDFETAAEFQNFVNTVEDKAEEND